MKFRLFIMGAALAVSACEAQQEPLDPAAEWQAPVGEAVDRRAVDDPVLSQAVEAGYADALRLWGLNGAEACPLIKKHMSSDDEAIWINALKGLAHCRDTDTSLDRVVLGEATPSEAVRIAAHEALGFTTPEDKRSEHVALVAGVLESEAGDAEKAAAIYGLMQSITYSGLTPADLPGLDIPGLMALATQPGAAGDEAAYLLTRLSALDSALELNQLLAADSEDLNPERLYHLTRLFAQFGDEAASWLMQAAAGADSDDESAQRYAVAAIRAMGSLSDPETRTSLIDLASGDAAPRFRHLALAALAARADYDEEIAAALWAQVDSDNEWLAVTALAGLAGKGEAAAIQKAAEWLEGGSSYQAFRAIGMLSGSEDGQATLQAYVDANPGTVRGQMAAGTLDPSASPARPVRETVPYAEAAASAGQRIALETTAGRIVIEMIEGAPYSAHAFLDMARSGYMDGMIWHRVIPGFVAQAGQKDDMAQFTMPTIREEWGAARHEPGTVGVATAGPDTGSAQFFINLETNRHLDGRYTVFGRVVEGMDVAYALNEGHSILSARVIERSR